MNSITCHIGIIPDDENDPIYPGFIDTMRDSANTARRTIRFSASKTGQNSQARSSGRFSILETGNMFREPHPANLILYANRTRWNAVEIFVNSARSACEKMESGRIATNHSDAKTALGKGAVNFELLIPRSKQKVSPDL